MAAWPKGIDLNITKGWKGNGVHKLITILPYLWTLDDGHLFVNWRTR